VKRCALAWVLALAAAGAAAAPTDAYPGAAASYLVVADGAPLWARAAAPPRPPASLIKLLAALVLLRDDWSPGAAVTVSGRAAAATGSRIGLRAGDSLAAGDALVAMLVRSANDACLALAEHAAGSQDAFAARMNELGLELGLTETHVVHPCGLDRPGQASSAQDLLKVATIALERPEIAAIVARRTAQISTADGRVLTMHNGNALLGRADGVRGMKTGYTIGAGKCLIAVADRHGHRVWLVMLNAPNRWWVASGMLDAAFRSL